MPLAPSFVSFLTRKKIIIIFILISLYAVLGFFIAPSIIKSTLVSTITEQLGRNATVKDIRVNPFVLSLMIKDFEMKGPDEELFFGFGRLYVNFQLSSIFRRAYTFHEIRVLEPKGQIKILPDGNLNFSDLLFSTEEQPKQAPDQDNGLPSVLIALLAIENGQILFKDLALPIPFETTFFPISLSLKNFSTRKGNENPYAFSAKTGDGERLSWEGNFSVDPFRSKGRVALTGINNRTLWEYIQHQVHFEVTGGSLDLAANYHMDAGNDAFQVELTDGELNIQDFGLSEKGSGHSLVSVPSFSVQDFDIDLRKKQISLASVNSEDVKLKGWLDSDGTFNLQTLFSREDSEIKGENSSETPDLTEVESPPWQISINELMMDNYSVAFENRTLAKPVRMDLEKIRLNLKNLSNQKGAQLKIDLAFDVDKTGTVKVNGLGGMDPVSADLTVKVAQLDLTPLQSYLNTVAQLLLRSGRANLEGDVKYGRMGDDGPEMSFKGRGSIDGLELADQLHSKKFLKWDALVANGILFDVAPNKVSISEIIAKGPYARVVIRPDKTVNVSSVFSPQEEEGADDAVYIAERPVTAVKSKGQGTMPITIDTFRIENGAVNFMDMSLKPNVAMGIQSLNGSIQGLTSEALGRADVLIEGKIEKHAPVRISGQINPLSQDVSTDLVLSFKNIGLTTFSPYSGKFVGSTIEKGKMSLDLQYKLSEDILNGENRIYLDQFTFGKGTDSPEATKLPVNLAVALLKDRKGIIDIDLPVRGNINDPEFSFGHLVLKALTNLITSIGASPFAALGNLVGGDGEKLSFVEFEFGSAVLQALQVAKLDKLAIALNDRPALRIEIEGYAEAQKDRLALAEKKLLRQLNKAKKDEVKTTGLSAPSSDAEEIMLSDYDFTRLLIKAYESKFGEHPQTLLADDQKISPYDGKVSPALISAAKKRLIEGMPIDESALRELARERAMQIKDRLVQKGGIPEQQVFMAHIEIAAGSDGDVIRTNLTLSGS